MLELSAEADITGILRVLELGAKASVIDVRVLELNAEADAAAGVRVLKLVTKAGGHDDEDSEAKKG